MNTFTSASATNVGMVRKLNEDSLFARDEVGLWTVADGMGGHQAGDVASQTVVQFLDQVLPCPTLADLVRETRNAILSANAGLLDMSDRFESGKRPGSTVASLLLNGSEAAVAWAGDSRIYRLRDGQAQQITRDHSHVQELLDQHLISEEEAEHHPMANVITRAVGIDDSLEIDVLHFNVRPGDRFLVCSDGLSRLASLQEIQEGMAGEQLQPSVDRFIDLALARGAPDNVTVILVECSDNDTAEDTEDDATRLYPSGGRI